MRRTHKVYIIAQMLKSALFLILPLIRRLVIYREKLSLSLAPDIIYLILFVTFAVLKWLNLRYEITQDSYIERRGVFIENLVEIPITSISSIDIEEGFFLRPFKAVRVAIDTISSKTRRSDAVIYLSRNQAYELSSLLTDMEVNFQYRAKAGNVIVSALSSANVTLGLLLLAPFVNNAGKLLGKEISDRLIGTVSYAQSLTARYIPSVFAVIAYIFVVSWLVSVAYLAARTANFRVKGNPSNLYTSRGFVVPRHSFLSLQGIRALIIRQTLPMFLFKQWEALICSAGYGSKGELTLLFPCEKSEKINRIAKMSLDITRNKISIFSKRRARTRLGVSHDFTAMHTRRFFCIKGIYLKRENIEALIIKQNPIQRRRGSCKFQLTPRNPKRHRYKIGGMNYGELIEKSFLNPKNHIL